MTSGAAILAGAALLALGPGCTKIIHPPGSGGSGGGGSGGMGGGTGGTGGSGGITPEPIHIQMLWMMHLPYSALNLTSSYALLHDGLIGALGQDNVAVDEDAVAPQYAPPGGPPGLLWGQSPAVVPEIDVGSVLRQAASSRAFEEPGAGAEQATLAALGQGLPGLVVPPEVTGGLSAPLFGPPLDGLVVVILHSTHRLCGLDEAGCQLAGAAPADYFTAANPDGSAAWLLPPGGGTGWPAPRVVWVEIVTGEGESPDALRARCLAVPGFNQTLVDDLEPSAAIYYSALAPALGGRGLLAEHIDLCDILGQGGPRLVVGLAHAIAGQLE